MKTSPQSSGSADRETRRQKREQSYTISTRSRLALLFLIVAVALIFLGVSLIFIMNNSGDEYNITILRQQNYSSTTIPFRRGTITDRSGTVLAASERRYIMILDPTVILASDAKNEEATLDALVNIFAFNKSDLKTAIEEKPDSMYIRYAYDLSEDQKDAFVEYETEYNKDKKLTENGKIVGVWFEQEYKRVYPYETLACTVLGFSGADSSLGNWGVEQYYNSQLTGTNGREYGYVNADGEAEREVKNAIDGNTLVTTIDYTIQSAVEQAIAEFKKEYDADNIGVVVMNPKNAEILALATNNKFDLNKPTDLTYMYTESEIEAMDDETKASAMANMWKNFAVQDAYEPGSTAKPFTVAAALEEAHANPLSSEYICEGKKTFGSGNYLTVIRCNKEHGLVNLKQSLMFSCNSAMMDIVSKVGSETFCKYLGLFGFGRQSGVDLPGETPGLTYKASDMGVTDLATNAFGQNYNVNMVQLAAAFSSLINGGNYYQPHVVRQILNSDGQVIKNIEPVLVRETVSSETCEFIKDALLDTVAEGTGEEGAIEGYSIGGKTGTAQKHPRSEKKYLVSFVGFTPAEDPEILVYVVVDNPKLHDEEAISAKIAIGLEKKIMEAILPYTGITNSLPPQEPEETEPAEGGTEGEDDRPATNISLDELIPDDGLLEEPFESIPETTEYTNDPMTAGSGDLY